MADALENDPLRYNFIFSDDKRTGALSQEELQTRRRLAYALATRNRPYPKTIGEGLTALGEAWGERGSAQELARLEEKQRLQDQKYLNPQAPTATPSVAAPAGVAPDLEPDQAVPGQAPLPGAVPPPPGPSNLPIVPPGQPQIPQQRPIAPIRQATAAPAPNLMRDQPEGPVGQPDVPVPGSIPLGLGGVRDQIASSLAGPSSVLASGEDARPPGIPPGQATPSPGVQPVAPLPGAAPAPPAPEPMGAAVAGLAQAADAGRGDIAAAALAQQPPGTPGLPVRVAQGPGPALSPPGVPAPGPVQQQQIAQAPPPVAPPIARPPAPPQRPELPPEQRYPEATKVLGPLRAEPQPPIAPPETARERQLREGAAFASGSAAASGLATANFLKEQRQAAHAQAMEEFKLKKNAWDLEHGKYITHELGAQELKAKLSEQAQKLEQEKLATSGIPKSTEGVAQTPKMFETAQRIKQQLNSGDVLTGLLSPQELTWLKVKAAAGAPPDPRIAATEQARADLTRMAGSLRMEVVGPGSVTVYEQQLLRDAAAGNITYDAKTIRAVTAAAEKVMLADMLQHQSKLEQFGKENPALAQTVYARYGLPMEQIVPGDHPSVRRMIDNLNHPDALTDFDKKFHTPGLAMKIIEREQRRR